MIDIKKQILNELEDRDITAIKQAFYRILCPEIRNNGPRVFIPHNLFSQSRLQTYLSNKELEFGREVYESEDYVMYNTIVGAVIHELINDKIIAKTTKRVYP